MAEGRVLFQVVPCNILFPGVFLAAHACSRSTCSATACATRSIRACAQARSCASHAREHGPAHRGPDRSRCRGAPTGAMPVEDVEPDVEPRRDRLPGRRVGLGQVGHRARGHGAAARRASSRRSPAASLLQGEDLLQAADEPPARPALHPDVDDLPGADDRAQSGDAVRRADRRGAAHPHRSRLRRAQAHPTHHAPTCACPSPNAWRTPIRTSSPAASASAIMIAMALVLRAGAADRRRADHRARRHHPGADPAADQGPAARARHRRAVHHPRLRRGRRDRRPGRGDAGRPGGRDGRDQQVLAPPRHPYTRMLIARGAGPDAADRAPADGAAAWCCARSA